MVPPLPSSPRGEAANQLAALGCHQACRPATFTLTTMSELNEKTREVAVTAHDLPLHCPRPGAPLWARHPRVFLDVLKNDEATCPYCGTKYSFTGEKPKGHH